MHILSCEDLPFLSFCVFSSLLNADNSPCKSQVMLTVLWCFLRVAQLGLQFAWLFQGYPGTEAS